MVMEAKETLSGTDRWAEQLTRYPQEQLKNLFLKTLPFSLLYQLEEAIEKKWGDWKTTQLSKNLENSTAFVWEISSEASELRLKDIIAVAKKIDALPVIDLLFAKKDSSEERRKAHTDSSKGWMRDLDPVTLLKLGERIEEAKKGSWRLLADSLGFDNRECRRFLSPHALLTRWIQKYPLATVARLYFEAKELKMERVCSFLDAIPLEGVRNIVLKKSHSRDVQLTRFHLTRIKEMSLERGIQIHWKGIAEKRCSYILEKNSTLSPFDSLWKSGNIHLIAFLQDLKNDSKLKEVVKQFEEEEEIGLFENKSSGGVTWEEIAYLADTPYINYPPYEGWGRFSRGPVDMYVIEKSVFKGFHPYNTPTFLEFLLYYWQDPEMGEKSNLDEFCLKIIDILKNAQDEYRQTACISSKVVESFTKAYLSIKPYRSYVKEIEVKKIAAEVKEVARPVLESKEIKKDAGNEECVVCLDNKPEAVLIPCGHLNCCLKCIQGLSNCPTCRTQIKQTVKVFKV